jgi:hypothetical protein
VLGGRAVFVADSCHDAPVSIKERMLLADAERR